VTGVVSRNEIAAVEMYNAVFLIHVSSVEPRAGAAC